MTVEKKISFLILFSVIQITLVSLNTTHGETHNLEVISHRGILTDYYYMVFGEIINNGASAVEQVNIQLDFYDELNVNVGSATAVASLSILMPGRRSPFIAYFLAENWEEVRSYEIGDISYEVSDGKPEKLAFVYYEYYNGTVSTHILNNSTGTDQKFTNRIKVVATLYENEKVVCVASDFLDIAPNEQELGWDMDTTLVGDGTPLFLEFGSPFNLEEVFSATRLVMSVESRDFTGQEEVILELTEQNQSQSSEPFDYRWIAVAALVVLVIIGLAYFRLRKPKRRAHKRRLN